MSEGVDLLILSNGPGEVTTWMRPVVRALRRELGDDRARCRISVILSPCPNATGREDRIAATYPEVDRVQAAQDFLPFLLFGKTAANWDWRERGVVIFLGGDQFFTLLIAKRLGYFSLVYAEWEARWYRFIDRFALRNEAILKTIPAPYQHKCRVVGDLMADILPVETNSGERDELSPTIGFLPGSKAAKLSQGVPLCLSIADHLRRQYPQLKFLLFLAPTLDLDTLAYFADPQRNSIAAKFDQASAVLVGKEGGYFFQTPMGTEIEIVTEFPAHQSLRRCQLCITTVGANTAELAALAIPMLVLLPTQELDAMRSWDGVGGILANLPLVGSGLAKLINWLILSRKRLYAWPNIWAKEAVVPELIGELRGIDIAKIVGDYLQNREALQKMVDRLRGLNPPQATAKQLAAMVSLLLG
jgi:hypothetical protein